MISVIRSGMDAALQNLDVTSNNIANARTTGYKKQEARFTDMYSSAITSPTGDRLGIGVQTPEITIGQKQGNLQKTNGVLDLAVEGNGLFQLQDEANPEKAFSLGTDLLHSPMKEQLLTGTALVLCPLTLGRSAFLWRQRVLLQPMVFRLLGR